jgi:hypothetical protein
MPMLAERDKDRTDIYLNGPLQRARGVIARYPDTDERYVFEYQEPTTLTVHMVGVRRPLLVKWLLAGEIVRSEVLKPWLGHASARADTVIEQRPEKQR